jgi:short-subunit dehydrogenase
MSLKKKSIFISGGNSGIGLATAKKYKAEGYRVGICGRNEATLDPLKEEFEVFKVDVTDLEQVKKAVNEFSSNGLDIMFANAGVGYAHKAQRPDFNQARQIFDININGVLNMFEVATEIFYKQGHGHLAATASIAGLNGLPGVSAYSGSKSAIIRVCESLRIDLKQFNINVSCVCPGFIDTPLTQKNAHSMPFLMNVDEAAVEIYYGIARNKDNIYFPKMFSGIVRVLGLLPRSIYRMIISSDKFNYSKK